MENEIFKQKRESIRYKKYPNRSTLIRQIKLAKKENNIEENEHLKLFMKTFFDNKYMEEKKEEVIVRGPEDANTPLYRNGAGYKTEIEDNKIKKMTVHYYNIDC